ncbi:MAG TPA: 4-(cytidine 5'-diphospho)-2-C-methyl-D-erythritol kinase [Chitinophagaceae bacterium]|nr:4-(cytidine 5'-diphospho)-2-C-methyl-D-erythritol kinase [Chitinophagaceae bacterium]
MILFPNCKINLGLHILRRRPDGFHDLDTVFIPVPVHDALEVVQQDPATETEVLFTASGLPIAGAPGENICLKAYSLLKADFPRLPHIRMHLHKTIPMGAGLGGGSADGAFTIMLLNRKFNLGLDEAALLRYAAQLGSDCAFFILNRPAIGSGRGEQLEPVSLPLAGKELVLVNPGIHVPTPWAFSRITPDAGRPPLKESILRDIDTWKEHIRNDFEGPVGAAYPEIKAITEDLYAAGALYAAMSGSGSTVYGIFPVGAAPALSFPGTYFIKRCLLPG